MSLPSFSRCAYGSTMKKTDKAKYVAAVGVNGVMGGNPTCRWSAQMKYPAITRERIGQKCALKSSIVNLPTSLLHLRPGTLPIVSGAEYRAAFSGYSPQDRVEVYHRLKRRREVSVPVVKRSRAAREPVAVPSPGRRAPAAQAAGARPRTAPAPRPRPSSSRGPPRRTRAASTPRLSACSPLGSTAGGWTMRASPRIWDTSTRPAAPLRPQRWPSPPAPPAPSRRPGRSPARLARPSRSSAARRPSPAAPDRRYASAAHARTAVIPRFRPI